MPVSRSVGRQGSAGPRVCNRPAYVSEAAGREAIELGESVGLSLSSWQQSFVKMVLAEGSDHLYAARECGLLLARQNGKTRAALVVVLHGMFLVGDPLTLWTAHQTKTAFEAFQTIQGVIEGSDELRREVRSISAAHGDEGVVLRSGARLRFLARSKSSGRGFSPQRIVFDEAQELSDASIEAMLPSMSAQPNRQSIHLGTVPGPTVNHPEHWRRMRDRGRAGDSPSLAWMEFSPVGSDDPVTAAAIDMDDPKVRGSANPRMTAQAIQDDREQMTDDGFARERLSIWPAGSVPDGPFGPGRWAACHGDCDEPQTVGLCLGVSVSMDRSVASIGGGAPLEDCVQVGVVDRRPGTDWVVSRIVELQQRHGCRVIVDGHGPASSLIPEMRDAGVFVSTMKLGDVLDACAAFYDAVQQRRIVHPGHPELDEAVRVAVKRPVGARWAWGCGSGDASMLEAVTNAAWVCSTEPAYDVESSIY